MSIKFKTLGGGSGGEGGAVDSVNGKTGVVVLSYQDVGADSTGSAATAIAQHEANLNPHDQYVKVAQLGASDGVATLDAAGKLSAAQVPELATARKITVADEAERLALSVYSDLTIACQADTGGAWGLNANDDPSVAANWTSLGGIPASGVTSFNSRAGIVSPEVGDYNADQITETTRKFVTEADKSSWTAKQDALVSGVNLKTINSQSLLGAGNITITGGAGGGSVSSVNGVLPDGLGNVQISKSDIALSQVDNTSDLDKPISTATQLALNGKQATLVSGTNIRTVNGTPLLGSGNIDISAVVDSSYTVVSRDGSAAGQVHSFPTNMQTSFGYHAYSLKEEQGLQNQTVAVDSFVESSAPLYLTTPDLLFNGSLLENTGGSISTSPDGPWNSYQIRDNQEAWYISLPSASARINPNMTSNTSPSGYITSASSSFDPGIYAPYKAFDGNVQAVSSDCWTTSAAPTAVSPQWLMLQVPSPVSISSYSVTNRNFTSNISSPRDWTLQGSNNGTDWTVLHTVSSSTDNVSNSVRSYTISPTATYSYFRLHITARNGTDNFVAVGQLQMFAAAYKGLIQDSVGNYYTASSGLLTPVAAPVSGSDFDSTGFFESGVVENAQFNTLGTCKLVTASPAIGTFRYRPYPQIAVQATPIDLMTYSEINSATVSATQTAAGKVRIAVSLDNIDWYVWGGSSWTSIGSLINNLPSAQTLITSGMTPANLAAVTSNQWSLLFPEGKPDNISFAYALDVDSPLTDVASIESTSLNVDFVSAWLKQSDTQVEIRWYNKAVTFKTVSSGNYKFAYQAPAEAP